MERQSDFITVPLKEDEKSLRLFIAHLQVPCYGGFARYYFQDVLIILSKRYIAHRYVLEQLKQIGVREKPEEVAAEKERRELRFDEEIIDIQRKAVNDKIQLIEENARYAQRYKNRMYSLVDKYKDGTEEKIYDSSYIVWVPYIQMRLKPWIMRFRERQALKHQQERGPEIIESVSLFQRGQTMRPEANRRRLLESGSHSRVSGDWGNRRLNLPFTG